MIILSQNVVTANSQGRTVQKSAHPKSFRVWGRSTKDGNGFCETCQTQLSTLSINNTTRMIFFKALKSFAQKHFSGWNWVFQKDSVPDHWMCKTLQWFVMENRDSISPDEWQDNSPNINPTDFYIWGILKAKVLATFQQS